jgi:hypothetical protein
MLEIRRDFPSPQTTATAAFLKDDKKKGDDNGDDPWEAVPTPKVWLAD